MHFASELCSEVGPRGGGDHIYICNIILRLYNAVFRHVHDRRARQLDAYVARGGYSAGPGSIVKISSFLKALKAMKQSEAWRGKHGERGPKASKAFKNDAKSGGKASKCHAQ